MRLVEVFIDTAYAIALSSPGDSHHQRAKELARQMQGDRTRLLTTSSVCVEIGDALAKLRFRQTATTLLRALHDDANVEIVHVTEDLYSRAYQLYGERPDKEWGMTDCISFVVMQDRGLTHALTTDSHFRQAGLEALLLVDEGTT